MEMNYCRRCGTPLTLQSDNNHSYQCQNGHTLFNNPAPTTGVFFVLPDNRRALVSVRAIEPRKGMLDAFGGFVEEYETFEEALVRELHEELGLQSDDYEPLRYLASGTGVYPYGGENYNILSSLFWSRLKPGAEPKPQDDVAEIRTVSIQKLDLAELHDDDIRKGFVALQKIFASEE